MDAAKKILKIAGKKLIKLTIFSIILGVCIFGIEILFLYSLQAFLIALKISQAKTLAFPGWIPTTQRSAFLFLILIGVTRFFLLGLKSYISGIANQGIIRDHREKMLEFSIREGSKVSSHNVTSLFSEIITRAADSILGLINLVVCLTTTFFLFCAGIKIAPIEMLLGVGFLLVFLIPTRFLDKSVSNAGMQFTFVWEKINKHLLEGMKHNLFFHAHGLVQDKVDSGLREIQDYEKYFKKYFLFSSFKNSIPGVLGIVILGTISFISINYLETSSASLFAFLYLFMRFAQGGTEVISNLTQLKMNYPSVETLLSWEEKSLSEQPIFSRDKFNSERINCIEELDVKLRSFFYGKEQVLGNINMKLEKSDRVHITGDSGAGKSTLLSIILGVNQVDDGSIEVNGLDLQQVCNYHEMVAYVGPDPFLFEGTIRENLTYGNLGVPTTDEKIYKCLKESEALEFVLSKSSGLKYRFEEHADISTGQKQRLSIARALLRDPEILILDEATANLDDQTEKLVLENIIKIMEKKILIYVTHKKSLEHFATKKVSL